MTVIVKWRGCNSERASTWSCRPPSLWEMLHSLPESRLNELSPAWGKARTFNLLFFFFLLGRLKTFLSCSSRALMLFSWKHLDNFVSYVKCPLRVSGMDSPVRLTALRADIEKTRSRISAARQSDLRQPQRSGWGRVDLSLCSISCISVLQTDLSRVINV